MTTLNSALSPNITRTINGREWSLRRTTLDDWSDFCEWINTRLDRKIGHPVDPDEMMQHAMTIPGMRWLIWRAMRHEGVDLDQVGTLLGSRIDSLTEIVSAIMDMPEAEEEAEGSDPQTPGP